MQGECSDTNFQTKKSSIVSAEGRTEAFVRGRTRHLQAQSEAWANQHGASGGLSGERLTRVRAGNREEGNALLFLSWL